MLDSSVICELTVFIKVSIESLKELSKGKPEIAMIEDKNINEITNIKIDRKYL